MKLVTVANKELGYMPYLLQSCKRHNATIDVIGVGLEWKGFNDRNHLMKDYLSTLHDDEIVCFIDAFDVVLLRPLEELEAFFREFSSKTGTSLIVGCDKLQQTYQRVFSTWRFSTCQDKKINAGTYIGYVNTIKEMISKLLADDAKPSSDDQMLMTKLCKREPNKFFIDCDSVFFLTVMNPFRNFLDTTGVEVHDGQLHYYGNSPFFAHGNGNTDMKHLLMALGYKVTDEFQQHVAKYHLKSRIGNLWKILPIIIAYVLCVLVMSATVFLVLVVLGRMLFKLL
jgi:hypothetical protein